MEEIKTVNELLVKIRSLVVDPAHIGPASIEIGGVKLNLAGNVLDFTLTSADDFALGYIAGYITTLLPSLGLERTLAWVSNPDPDDTIVRIRIRYAT